MRPYVVQNLKSDLGEAESARWIARQTVSARTVACEGAEVTILPEDRVLYECGETAALTLLDYPERGAFAVVFISGSEPTVLTVPNTLRMPDGFTVEAKTRYEINVLNGYALCAGWAVSAS